MVLWDPSGRWVYDPIIPFFSLVLPELIVEDMGTLGSQISSTKLATQ